MTSNDSQNIGKMKKSQTHTLTLTINFLGPGHDIRLDLYQFYGYVLVMFKRTFNLVNPSLRYSNSK